MLRSRVVVPPAKTAGWDFAFLNRTLVLLAGFIGLSLAIRLPFAFYADLNWDEALYRMMADSVLRGQPPYVEIWDRKPVGMFLILATVQAAFGDGILALRIATAVSVGIGSYFLAAIGRTILSSAPAVGITAGCLYLFYSTRNGGDGTNAELFFEPLCLAGFWLLLQIRPRRSDGIGLAFVAGLLMGAAFQVKYNAIFDIAAFGAMYLVLRMEGLDAVAIRNVIRIALAVGLGIVAPTGAVIAWYASVGAAEAFFSANFTANAGMLAGAASPLRLDRLPYLLGQMDVLTLGTAAAIVLGPLLADTAERRRAVLAIAIWLVAMALSLLFMRRFAGHFTLQVMPAMAMATAFVAVRLTAILARGRVNPRWIGVLFCLLFMAWIGRGTLRLYSAALEVVQQRLQAGIPHWGDVSLTAAAAIRSRLSPSDLIYVFSPTLEIYRALGHKPPTRFPFVEHLWANYAPVDGLAELERILAQRPKFIFVEDPWLPGGKLLDEPNPDASPIFAALHATLAREYVVDGRARPYVSRGGGPIGLRTGLTVFRLRNVPAYVSHAKLQYQPG